MGGRARRSPIRQFNLCEEACVRDVPASQRADAVSGLHCDQMLFCVRECATLGLGVLCAICAKGRGLGSHASAAGVRQRHAGGLHHCSISLRSVVITC